jgi:Ca-activated chloride channel family protein
VTLQELSSITFAHAWVLWLLLLIPVLAFLRGRAGGTAALQFSTTDALVKLGVQRKSNAGRFLAMLTYLAMACLIVALARPQLGRTVTRIEASGIDIMLAIDVSRSMLAEDFTSGGRRTNRLDAVRQVTEQFIESRPSDRIGIVAFAGRPYLVSPLTLDHDWLLRNIDRIRIGLVEDGTAIGSALASASSRLRDKEAKSKIVVLLSDGDNNAGRIMPLTAAEAARALGIRVYTIGAGSRGLVPFPFQDGLGRTIYRNVNMEFDEETLQQIAAITGGKYFRATDTRSLEEIFDEIDQLEKTTIETKRVALYKDFFEWFLAASLAFLGLEALLSNTLWRRLP